MMQFLSPFKITGPADPGSIAILVNNKFIWPFELATFPAVKIIGIILCLERFCLRIFLEIILTLLFIITIFANASPLPPGITKIFESFELATFMAVEIIRIKFLPVLAFYFRILKVAPLLYFFVIACLANIILLALAPAC